MYPLNEIPREDLVVADREGHALPAQPAIRREPPVRNWEKVSSIVTAMGVLVGVVTFALGYLQYTSQLESGRAEHTLDMIEMWETRGYRDAYLALGKEVAAFLDDISPEDLALAENNERAAANLRNAISAGVLKSDTVRADFDKVVYFFNRLGLCVEANVCSDRTARIFFDDTVLQFMANFGGHIRNTQQELPGYATGLTLLEARFED